MTKPSKASKASKASKTVKVAPSAADEVRPPRTKRRFSEEFKLNAVRLVRRRQAENRPAAEVARELGILPGILSEWVRLFGRVEDATPDGGDTGETVQDEVRRLRREVAILKEEREFAKKAAAFFAKESL